VQSLIGEISMKKTVLLPVAMMLVSGSVLADSVALDPASVEKGGLDAAAQIQAQKQTIEQKAQAEKEHMHSSTEAVDAEVKAAIGDLEKQAEQKRDVVKNEQGQQIEKAQVQKETYEREVAAKREEAARKIGADAEQLGEKRVETGEKIETAAADELAKEQGSEKQWWQFWK